MNCGTRLAPCASCWKSFWHRLGWCRNPCKNLLKSNVFSKTDTFMGSNPKILSWYEADLRLAEIKYLAKECYCDYASCQSWVQSFLNTFFLVISCNSSKSSPRLVTLSSDLDICIEYCVIYTGTSTNHTHNFNTCSDRHCYIFIIKFHHF